MKRSEIRAASCALLILSVALFPLAAEESFGFASPEESGDGTTVVSAAQAVTVGGEVSAGLTAYMETLDDISEAGDIEAGNLFSGKLEFNAKGSNADAVINLKLKPAAAAISPLSIDEAYLRGYFGKLDIEAGLRKLTWGKADSMGPLDVINPVDLTDLTVTDSLERKIARPLVHATLALGSFTRLEAAVIPSFEGHRFTTEGRWAPAQVTELKQTASLYSIQPAHIYVVNPAIDTLKYTQAGLRYTATVSSTDIGLQYFYGNLFKPAIMKLSVVPLTSLTVEMGYNRYHQIGLDYASVLAGFNVRLEGAANITEDLEGDDGSVYNSALLWSAGFDRIILANVNLNLQGSGSVRLMDDKIADTIADTEVGTEMAQTKITAQLSRMFFRDSLELKAAAVYDIGYADWLLLPSVVWTKGDIEAEAVAGFFGGDEDGELGQYDDNDYVKVSVKYRF